MEIQGIHHTGLVVKNLDRSIYFYHDILGLPFANEPTEWFSGSDLAKGLGVPEAEIRLVALWGGEHSRVELIEYRNRPESSTEPAPNNHLGAAHVCFRVEDVQGKKKTLEEQGVEFYSDINAIVDGPLTGWSWVYFGDPDGLTLELVEIAHQSKVERDQVAQQYLETRPSLDSLEPLF